MFYLNTLNFFTLFYKTYRDLAELKMIFMIGKLFGKMTKWCQSFCREKSPAKNTKGSEIKILKQDSLPENLEENGT